MFLEFVVAFLLILATASIIYLIGRRASPKPVQSENERMVYACGEKTNYKGPRVSVSLYKYLIYFVILDSSVLLVAFASITGRLANPTLVLLYLVMMLASSVLLFDGGKEQ